MKTPRNAARYAGFAAVALIMALAGSSPAQARLDPGGPTGESRQSTENRHCPLKRIGAQLIRCDFLTGTGADAPAWIPERQ